MKLNMKSVFLAAAVSLGVFASNSQAAPILDQLIDSSSPKSGKPFVADAFTAATGQTFTKDDVIDVSYDAPMRDLETGYWVINFTMNQPGYFALKFGLPKNAFTDDDHYFFSNFEGINQLVFSDAQVNQLTGGNCIDDGVAFDPECNIGKLSHIVFVAADIPGDPGSVPEPASLALLGAGVAALGLRRRRR